MKKIDLFIYGEFGNSPCFQPSKEFQPLSNFFVFCPVFTGVCIGAQNDGQAHSTGSYLTMFVLFCNLASLILIQHQAVAFMLADMAIAVEASRLATQRAAWEVRLGGGS